MIVKTLEGVLDPFEIEPDWFEVELVAFQVKPGPGAVGETASKVHETIEKLGLNRDEFCKARETYFRDYMENGIPVDDLARRAPLVACAMARAGLLRLVKRRG